MFEGVGLGRHTKAFKFQKGVSGWESSDSVVNLGHLCRDTLDKIKDTWRGRENPSDESDEEKCCLQHNSRGYGSAFHFIAWEIEPSSSLEPLISLAL